MLLFFGGITAEKEDKKSDAYGFWAFTLAIVCIVLMICAWMKFPNNWFSCIPAGKIDLLAVAFSGLAFAAMIVTLYYQRQELRLQRKELADTREVLKQTQQATNKFADAMTASAQIEEYSQELQLLNAMLISHQQELSDCARQREAINRDMRQANLSSNSAQFLFTPQTSKVVHREREINAKINFYRKAIRELHEQFAEKRGLLYPKGDQAGQ